MWFVHSCCLLILGILMMSFRCLHRIIKKYIGQVVMNCFRGQRSLNNTKLGILCSNINCEMLGLDHFLTSFIAQLKSFPRYLSLPFFRSPKIRLLMWLKSLFPVEFMTLLESPDMLSKTIAFLP